MKGFKHKDLLGMGQLSVEDIELILDTAESLKEISQREIKKVPTLRGKSVVNFFYRLFDDFFASWIFTCKLVLTK